MPVQDVHGGVDCLSHQQRSIAYKSNPWSCYWKIWSSQPSSYNPSISSLQIYSNRTNISTSTVHNLLWPYFTPLYLNSSMVQGLCADETTLHQEWSGITPVTFHSPPFWHLACWLLWPCHCEYIRCVTRKISVVLGLTYMWAFLREVLTERRNILKEA